MQDESIGEDKPPPILVLSRKKPHLIFLMGLCLITGLSLLLGGPISEDVPYWVSRAWSGLLGATGTIVLVAHLQKWDRERGMLIERGGLIIQAATVLAYTWCLPQFLGWNVGTVLTIIAGLWWSIANVWEIRLIAKDLDMIADARRLGARSANATDE